MSHQDFWLSVLKRLLPTIKKNQFITWFQNTTVSSIDAGVLTVGVPTVFAENHIANKYQHILLVTADTKMDSMGNFFSSSLFNQNLLCELHPKAYTISENKQGQ